MALQQYAWGVGHNLALAALSNVEDDLFPHSRPRKVGIRSQPIDWLPVRTELQAGYEAGDGRVDHRWEMTLNQACVEFILNKFSLSKTNVSTAATIYTRQHELGDLVRCNCYIILPQPGRDMTYIRQGVFRVTWRFMALVAL